ncbi:hypothetical protein KNP414_07167 [Paenibacillus mucilaginosus KNP414]|uniref:Uncharacterized protein n=1 Tax=Paenibacillus mucilaginosus (strain KNP414) TaxID=1036673 RepID=F8FM51_PAEMK|nr:hypothetical protein KNP414_07167 [Paenibacillus mucilaginosus KNP414]
MNLALIFSALTDFAPSKLRTLRHPDNPTIRHSDTPTLRNIQPLQPCPSPSQRQIALHPAVLRFF